MAYTHFRMIAYEVPTAAFSAVANDPPISGWAPGKVCPEVKRLRIPEGLKNLTDDSTNRLRRLACVVDAAEQALAKLGDDKNTLKIFMLPEFYFRPPILGVKYAYNTYPDMEAMDILKALDGMFEHPDFYDWLFVCGSVLWNTSSDLLQPMIYLNTAAYKQGGIRLPSIDIGTIEKRLPSSIDGIPREWTPGNNDKVQFYHNQWATRRLNVFDVAGVTCGLEVCLDHYDDDRCRVLKQVLADWEANEGEEKSVKLHFLTAGGMTITPGSVAAKVGGYILRNDGLYNVSQSELRQVTGYNVTDTVTNQVTLVAGDHQFKKGEKSQAVLKDVAALGNPLVLDASLWVDAPDANYRVFPQRVRYYPALAIPA